MSFVLKNPPEPVDESLKQPFMAAEVNDSSNYHPQFGERPKLKFVDVPENPTYLYGRKIDLQITEEALQNLEHDVDNRHHPRFFDEEAQLPVMEEEEITDPLYY